jgi:hypothetical protein
METAMFPLSYLQTFIACGPVYVLVHPIMKSHSSYCIAHTMTETVAFANK